VAAQRRDSCEGGAPQLLFAGVEGGEPPRRFSGAGVETVAREASCDLTPLSSAACVEELGGDPPRRQRRRATAADLGRCAETSAKEASRSSGSPAAGSRRPIEWRRWWAAACRA